MITREKVEQLTKELREAGWPNASGLEIEAQTGGQAVELERSLDSLILTATTVRQAIMVRAGFHPSYAAGLEKRIRKALGYTS